MQDLVRTLLQVVYRVGQVGALRVVEVDLVLDGIGFHPERYGLRRRVDLVVAGDVDRLLRDALLEGLVLDDLGFGDLRGRALEIVVHRVGQVGALRVDDIENIVLHLNDEALRSDDARLVSSRTLRVNSALLQAHRISEGLAIDHRSFADPIFFRDGVPVVIDNVGEISSLLPLGRQGHVLGRHNEGVSRSDVRIVGRELPALELVTGPLGLLACDNHSITCGVAILGIGFPRTLSQIIIHEVLSHVLGIEVRILLHREGEPDLIARQPRISSPSD